MKIGGNLNVGTGSLLVIARTADEALPIPYACVHIMDYSGEVLYDLITDENGETELVSLNTIDKNLSLDPEYSGIPYTSYNVEVVADGYNSLYIEGVHIFDGEEAIQPAALIPMQLTRDTPIPYGITIGKFAVEMNTPRDQIGPTSEPKILRLVVIPNPITVHLGRPDSSASNVQVSFPDYVKNVASSEIYPTWPEESLRANIYAIITFALNRVYTEWYRSRGYNFDITNSTAYDQYFVYGRTIYESISIIVDEIFNEYVRKIGYIAPYFTQFCNGTTVTCSGLSQWGTVTLAEEGMSALEILRYYYSNNIEIAETNIITNVITSYPGTALRVGSTGLDVQTIQTYLNRIRKNYPAIPLITDEPGVFGSTTQAAVKKFQSIFNLTSDGIVGKATWNKISSIYVAVTRLAELNNEGDALGIGTVPPSSVLSWGSTGNDVITLQYLLNFISDFYPTIPSITQNGVYDYQTAEAVKAFQRMMGLTADGVVGPNTWKALYDTYWSIKENAEEPSQGNFEYVVRPGDSLWLIAQKFGTTVDAIKAANKLTSNVINVGQVLQIPTNGASGFTYTVKSGDSLWLIAQRFNTSVDAIKALNNLSSDMITAGQVLLIPQ